MKVSSVILESGVRIITKIEDQPEWVQVELQSAVNAGTKIGRDGLLYIFTGFHPYSQGRVIEQVRSNSCVYFRV